MAEIGIKGLKSGASSIIDEVQAGAAYVVTKRGRPVAVLLPVEDAEDVVLASASEYVEMRRVARAAYESGESVVLDELD